MRKLFQILLLLGIAIGLSLLASYNDGYVLIVKAPYRLKMSINLLLLLIVFSFGLLHLLLRLSYYIRALPASVREFKIRHHLQSRFVELQLALDALLGGDYQQAEHVAAKALQQHPDISLFALIAARAAHLQQSRTLRNRYLSQAKQSADLHQATLLLMEAEMAIEDGDLTAAQNLLDQHAEHYGQQTANVKATALRRILTTDSNQTANQKDN